MSLSLLLEKYDVSTDEGLQKALNEIEKEESEVDAALSGVLSRACSLEGRLRTASQAYTKLSEVKTDAQIAADMVDKTAGLARDVSAKVRQLDLARSRVAECQRRVHDLIDLQLCSAGVEAAIKAHDYETGAGHVSRFLSMDPGSVAAARARGAPDPRDAMTRAANTLREHLVRKFEEAARKEDEPSVERLFKLFPQIGRAEEGVDLLAKYLATQTEAAIRRACVVSDVSSEAAVFADAVTRVVEAGGAGVERARHAAAGHAPGRLHRALRAVQPAVCAGVRRIFTELVLARRLESDPHRAGISHLSAEPVLAELALTHSRIWLYFTFLRRKAEVDAAPLKEAEKKACVDAVEKIINECDLMRTAQDILGHYLTLERYFLEESVNKALKMATPQVGVTTSSLVDDVFFIARKVIRRAVSSGSVDGACAVLNEVSAVLERGAAGALRRWLRAPPHEPLPLPGPRPARYPPDPQDRDVEAQKILYLAHMNEAESGADWAERLASEACAAAGSLARGGAERAKLASCAAGLGAAAAAFRAAHELALAALGAALRPKLAAWAQRLVDPAPHADEMEDDADALPQALEQLTEAARAHISSRAVDALLLAALADLAARAEAALTHNRYDREGGLAVERRARRLAAWAGSSAGAARERCARLTQAAALLALELPEHARDALLPTPRLAAPEAKDILARRYPYFSISRSSCLTQAAALLALELPEHARDALLPTPRLAAPEAKDILARRYPYFSISRSSCLTQAAALLALELPEHARDALLPTPRLAAPEAKDILARRYPYFSISRSSCLTQAAALLALELPEHARDALLPTPRLAAPEAKDILARRYPYFSISRSSCLTQAAALLALELPEHARDALLPTPRLAAPEAKDILARRYPYFSISRSSCLTQAAALLALELPEHARDALLPTPRLAAPEAKDILARRYPYFSISRSSCLTQAAALLALELPEHARDALLPTPRLAAPEAKDILARRYPYFSISRSSCLTQAAALLALELPEHARDALLPTPRLAAPEAKDILARRYPYFSISRSSCLTQAAALLALELPEHARDALLPTPRLAAPEAKDILARRYPYFSISRSSCLTQAAALLALELPEHARDALLPTPRLAAPEAKDILARRYPYFSISRSSCLTQAAALLALELPEHARDALLPTPRLAAPEAKDILARRTDFKMEDIKRLKL